jgi:hypothetical protein
MSATEVDHFISHNVLDMPDFIREGRHFTTSTKARGMTVRATTQCQRGKLTTYVYCLGDMEF